MSKWVTIDMLRERFAYDSETGALTWKIPSQWRPAGRLAGSAHSEGYLHVTLRIDGRMAHLYAHRIAWALHHGAWPEADIDHINGNRKDNRIANLRAATRSQNNGNMGVRARNKSGFKGVYWNNAANKWQAMLGAKGGVRRYLGVYNTPEEAHEAYMQAAKAYFGEFAFSGRREDSHAAM
jgi:hypothetical protein